MSLTPIELWEHIKKSEKDFNDPRSAEHQDIDRFASMLLDYFVKESCKIAESYTDYPAYPISVAIRERWKPQLNSLQS